MTTNELTVGLVQLAVKTGRMEDNLRRAEAWVKEARARGCRLVVLPEAFATALDLPQCHARATSVPGAITEWLAALARREELFLAAGLLEREAGAVFSSTVLVGPDGALLHRYRRMNVYDLEAHFLTSGDACRVVDTPLGRIGLVLGYDIQFPEALRILFAQRVEIIVCPALLLRPFAESVRTMVRARPAENCCYLLFCSATGENTLAGLTYMGGSAVVQGPVGIRAYCNEFRRQEPILAEADREETLLVAHLDMVALRRLQDANPLFKDFQRSGFFQALNGGLPQASEREHIGGHT